MEIVAVDPIVLNMSDEPGIKAGMMAVVPAWDEEATEGEEGRPLPENSLLCVGQHLERELYPHLSKKFPGEGLYLFQLPDLRGKFIMGVNEEGEFMLGDGIIYYQDIPSADRPSRNILDA